MKIELKNVKIAASLSEETTAFTASLYIDGKRAAYCSNRGHGDPILFHFDDRQLEQEFYAYCKAQPPVETEWGALDQNADLLVGDLIAEHEHKQWLKRQAKRKILFRIIGDEENAYRTVDRSEKAREWVHNKYGDEIIEIH